MKLGKVRVAMASCGGVKVGELAGVADMKLLRELAAVARAQDQLPSGQRRQTGNSLAKRLKESTTAGAAPSRAP
jgi:hypothetical protein